MHASKERKERWNEEKDKWKEMKNGIESLFYLSKRGFILWAVGFFLTKQSKLYIIKPRLSAFVSVQILS